MPVYLDSWSPYVYGTPEDGKIYVDQGNVLEPFTALGAVVSNEVDGTFWNGTALVPYADINLVDIMIAGTMPQFRKWEVTIPWSQIGSGNYVVRTYRIPANSNHYYTTVPWTTTPAHIVGPRSPNPAGVTVGSSFGGPDALRLIDPAGHPIAGVQVKATVLGINTSIVYDRGAAASGVDGRWTLDRVLQPDTEHRIDFEKTGYTFTRQIITTGSAI